MTPSPTPLLALDPIGIVNGVSSALKGGTVTEVIAGVLILLVTVFYFVFKGQITKRQQEDAANATNAGNTDAHGGAVGQSGSQETEAAQAQAALAKAERDVKLQLLNGLSDEVLLMRAISAYGADRVKAAIDFHPLAPPLTLEDRAKLYSLYGVDSV